MVHLGKIPVDTLAVFEVSLTWVGLEAGHGHDGSGDVQSSNLYGPLHSADEGLVDLDALDG